MGCATSSDDVAASAAPRLNEHLSPLTNPFDGPSARHDVGTAMPQERDAVPQHPRRQVAAPWSPTRFSSSTPDRQLRGTPNQSARLGFLPTARGSATSPRSPAADTDDSSFAATFRHVEPDAVNAVPSTRFQLPGPMAFERRAGAHDDGTASGAVFAETSLMMDDHRRQDSSGDAFAHYPRSPSVVPTTSARSPRPSPLPHGGGRRGSTASSSLTTRAFLEDAVPPPSQRLANQVGHLVSQSLRLPLRSGAAIAVAADDDHATPRGRAVVVIRPPPPIVLPPTPDFIISTSPLSIALTAPHVPASHSQLTSYVVLSADP